MANIKISELTPKGANLASTDLLEISEYNGSGYTTKSITGQEIIDAAGGGGVAWGDITGTLADQSDLNSELSGKQDNLISGTNIKTINGSSVLGSGDLTVGGGGGTHALLKPNFGQSFTSMITAYSFSSASLTASRMVLTPFIPANSFTAETMYINATGSTAGALARILVYSDLNGKPYEKLMESTDLNLSTTGVKSYVSYFDFVAGTTYWMCVHANTTAGTLSHYNTLSLLPIYTFGATTSYINYIVNSVTFGSAPATLSSMLANNTGSPLIGLTSL